ncbi:peptide-binding protein [Candidatus Desulfovibrio trichonymphae]|uniref:Oligopeptide/dipeptide ABC transporter substrate-binding protein DppA n=1 Tax=Candidatus Desulfovibrio trichonymphae TaxID=1725232 RepID=A0A1J1DYL9_9BACT|nr:peptide-binding protein [Candidatus Desulfovibrio trichonymphae]BAV92214.1 oligopeptide/dipeptide ABC transporter substrate-binding protein DppA [Candidatus Desulfovibrio trichonymphae]
MNKFFCMRSVFPAAAAVILALCLPAFSGAVWEKDDTGQAFGDRIIFGSVGEASNLIPYLSTDSASHEVADLIFVAPLRYNADLQIEPWAAETFSVEDEGRFLRFTLRKGILWEDGRELTAEDVAFTYRLVIDPATASPYADDFLRVKEFRVTGRYSFEARYENFFARAVASWMNPVLPKHILEGQDIRKTPFSRKPLGAGAYRLKDWAPGSRITLAASPTYFMGRPRIAEVVYRIIPDNASMFMETRANRLDVMNLSPLQYLRETDGPAWEANFDKYHYLASVYVFLGFNMEHPFFKDVRVRRAISLAVNRDDIVKGVLLGQGVPAFGPFMPGTWAYHPALSPVRQNVEAAAALLAEAGFADNDGDGVLERDGRPFSFTILTNQGNDQRILTAEVIQNELAAVGIDARIRTVEWAAFIREFVDKGRFDAVILGWTIPQDPDIYTIWHSSQAREGGLNFTRYISSEVDALLEEARTTPDQSVRAALYRRFQEVLDREQPYCFLFVPYALPLVQRRFMGIKPALAGIMYNFDEWWVPKSAQRYTVTP